MRKDLITRKKQVEEKKKHFLKLYKQSRNIFVTCKAMRVPRSRVYAWKEQDHKFAETVNQIREDWRQSIVDRAESNIEKGIKKGCLVSSIFTLKTQGKDRGWIEKAEIQHTGDIGLYKAEFGNEPLTIEHENKNT